MGVGCEGCVSARQVLLGSVYVSIARDRLFALTNVWRGNTTGTLYHVMGPDSTYVGSPNKKGRTPGPFGPSEAPYKWIDAEPVANDETMALVANDENMTQVCCASGSATALDTMTFKPGIALNKRLCLNE